MATKKEEKVIVKQVRSAIRHPKTQLATLKALGLGRIGKTANHVLTPPIVGMIKTVSHLVLISKEK